CGLAARERGVVPARRKPRGPLPGVRRGPPAARVRAGQELAVAPTELGAPGCEARSDLLVLQAGVAEHEARDPLRGLARMVDLAQRLLLKDDAVDARERVEEGGHGHRVVAEQERA